MAESNEIPLINVRNVLREKNAALAKWIPGFLFRFFEKLIHQEDMNRVLTRTRGIEGAEFIKRTFEEIGAKTEANHTHRVPASGGVIIASNHPLGGLDGMGLIYEVHKIRPDVKFLVNDILINIKPLQRFFIGVNKHGTNAKASLLAMERTFASDQAILIFPAGLVSRKQSNKIFDLQWHKSFISKAIKYGKDIIPTFIEGNNSQRFYNFANWRKRLNIKSNLEMLLLPSEMFRQNGKTVTIHFGKPVNAKTLSELGDAHTVADAMRHFVYLLQDDPEADFEKFYKSFVKA